MPFLSIIVPTMRVGGLDLILSSLAKSVYQDFELVLVDALHKHRRARVEQEAKDRFLKVVHVAPAPNPFPVAAFCQYANAGLVAASGEVAVFMVDYSIVPPALLGAHAAFHVMHGPEDGVMMPHRYVGLDVDKSFPRYSRSDADRYAEDVRTGMLDDYMWSIGKSTGTPADDFTVDGGTMAKADADPKLKMPAGPIANVFFHGKNESVRLARAIEINGWDEDLDGTHGWQDSDFADRLTVKAGVRWTLDPRHAVEIANPRGVFPFAKRTRDFRTNEGLWYGKRAEGYPTTNRWNLRERRAERAKKITDPEFHLPVQKSGPFAPRPLRIAMIYGEFSSAIHGPFDIDGLYTRTGLTGSESSFFNLMRSLAERGHEVVAFCHSERAYAHPSGATILPIQALEGLPRTQDVDAVIAWNEPDYLQFAPYGVLCVVDQQLNDWVYCRRPDWRDLTDLFVFPSENSRQHHIRDEQVTKADGKGMVIPNSVDLDLFAGASERHPRRVVYCSSPDRGLHHLLGMWPEVRARVPDATLKVFYRLDPWLSRARDNADEVGRRARYIEAALPRLRHLGVEVVGPVSNEQMAR
jgi:glycosyltransferase involved in cell wall biosynthesis